MTKVLETRRKTPLLCYSVGGFGAETKVYTTSLTSVHLHLLNRGFGRKKPRFSTTRISYALTLSRLSGSSVVFLS